MNALQKLKFVVSKRESKYGKTSVPQRRVKLATRIDEQIALATAQMNGRGYEVMQSKTTVDKLTGERTTKEAAKRIKPWFWSDSAGKVNFEVQYGAMKLELSAGKNAVQVAGMKELIATLQLIKTAATAGELDSAIDAALAARKTKKAA